MPRRSSTATLARPGNERVQIPLDLIDPAPDNPRKDLGDLDTLAASIKLVGVLQPVTVQPHPASPERYLLLFGERRWAASKLAKLTTIPAIVEEPSDDGQRRQRMLIENLERSDLKPHEEAAGYQGLLDAGWRPTDIAARFDRARGYVSKRLSLLKLPPKALDLLDKGTINLGEALALTAVAEEPKVVEEVLRLSKGKEARYNVEGAVAAVVRERERKVARETSIAELEAAGVEVLTGENPYNLQRGIRRLSDLQPRMTPAAHSRQSCHAAVLDHNGVVTYVCVDPAKHGPKEDPELADAVKEERAAKRAANKASRQAATARLGHVTSLLAKRLSAQDVLDIAVRRWIGLSAGGGAVDEGIRMARDLLGLEPVKGNNGYHDTYDDRAALLEHVDQGQSVRVALALTAGISEAQLGRNQFYRNGAGITDYIRLLEQRGLKLTPVDEELVATLTGEPGEPPARLPSNACPACDGEGVVPGREDEACPSCEGTGRIPEGDLPELEMAEE